MKKNYILILTLFTLTFNVNAQNLILNPGFENNTLTVGCYINQSASNVNASLNDITAFYGGTMDGIEIGVSDNCYAGGANSGTTHIVMAGLSGPNMFESISFNLSSSIISGETYNLTFYAANSSPGGSESLSVGVSTTNTSFGTQAILIPLSTNSSYTQYLGTFTAPASGDYLTIEPAAIGNFWFGLDDFFLEIDTSLSLEEVELTNNNIKIYPNPSNDFIQINGLIRKERYRIYNTLGAEIKEGEISDNEKINIQILKSGLYFVKFEDGNTLKFIKE